MYVLCVPLCKSLGMCEYVCMYVCMLRVSVVCDLIRLCIRVCKNVCMYSCVCVCMCVCVRAYLWTFWNFRRRRLVYWGLETCMCVYNKDKILSVSLTVLYLFYLSLLLSSPFLLLYCISSISGGKKKQVCFVCVCVVRESVCMCM